ncbi:MAG: hypothetical protein C3F13_17775 [Anaerolineales bacterium]|nr:hypothetical protein [Anaerolineae bacterium]PWB49940.1 MAG: hypothetical protein C3F13_17775 [Anaerolineales bacterium]
MAQKVNFLEKPFLLWMLANLGGFILLGLASLVVPRLTPLHNIFASTLMIALPISIPQWLALRRLGPVSWLWILSFPIGLLAAVLVFRDLPIGWLPFVDDESPLSITTGYLLGGLLIGLPQWYLLRPILSRASLFLLATAGGLALGILVVLITDLINISGILSIVVVALFYTGFTGIILSRGLVKPDSPRSFSSETVQPS